METLIRSDMTSLCNFDPYSCFGKGCTACFWITSFEREQFQFICMNRLIIVFYKLSLNISKGCKEIRDAFSSLFKGKKENDII